MFDPSLSPERARTQQRSLALTFRRRGLAEPRPQLLLDLGAEVGREELAHPREAVDEDGVGRLRQGHEVHVRVGVGCWIVNIAIADWKLSTDPARRI